jgi:hypothetical protein
MPASRYDVTLDTGSNSDEDAYLNHYDQVIAMSQGIINASFRDMFEAKTKPPEMVLNHLRGNIDAILDAPSIMINGKTKNTTEIYYTLR